MAKADTHAWKTIEQAAEDQPQRVRSGFERPLPRGASQTLVALKNRRRRHRINGMQIDQRAKRFGPLPEWIERRIVEVLAVSMAVDHDPAESQLAYAALEFVGRGEGILHSEVAETRIMIRPFVDLSGQKIVGRTGSTHRGRRVAFGVYPGTRQCEDRASNAGLVHSSKPHLAEVSEPRECLVAALRRQIDHRRIPVFDKVRAQEVLLERDLADHPFPRCGAMNQSSALCTS